MKPEHQHRTPLGMVHCQICGKYTGPPYSEEFNLDDPLVLRMMFGK